MSDKRQQHQRSVELILLLLSLISNPCTNALILYRKQSIAVRGQLLCAQLPQPNIPIQLLDYDFPDSDDVLASGFTTSNGSFLLKGHEWEISNIDPVLKIFHKCNDKGIPCERIWPIALPAKYITFGSEQPSKIMDIGILNLEVVLFRESRECVANRQQHSTD